MRWIWVKCIVRADKRTPSGNRSERELVAEAGIGLLPLLAARFPVADRRFKGFFTICPQKYMWISDARGAAG